MELIKKINSIKTINELEAYKAQVNEAFAERKEFINLCEVANNTSIKNFGYIKEAFEAISPSLFQKEEVKA
jgi:hypothetical protein